MNHCGITLQVKIMKAKTKRIVIFCFTASILLYAAEFLIDLWFGDGDGSITQYNIHLVILSIQFVLLSVAAFLFISKSVFHLFSKETGMMARMGKASLFMIYLVALLLLAELFSRIIAPSEGTFDRIYQAENARHPSPYVMFKGKPGSLTGYGDEIYNEHGYRGKYPSVPKSSNEFRIIVLGGSAVWEGESMLTDYLEAALKKNDLPAASVYNFGVVGANSSMQWITVMNEVISLQPDLVVFYDGANDIIHPLHYDPRPGYPFNFLIYENNPFLLKSFPALTLLAYKSNLYRLMARKYLAEKISKQTSLRKEAGYMTDEWKKEIASIYLDNERKTNHQCRMMNIPFMTFFQPTVYSKQQLSDEERKFVEARAGEKQHVEMLRKMITGSEKADSAFYDLSDVFDGMEAHIFRDNVHISNAGRERVAERMASLIMHELHKQDD